MTRPTWTATLYAEVRSKGTPGKPKIEHQVYTVELPADPERPDDPTITLAYQYGSSVYLDKWRTTEFDPAARTSVFRRTFRASDKMFQRLELYGWKRRKDLEEKESVMPTPATKAHHDELRNVCNNYPVFAGNTISHETARDICAYGWIERNKNGDWIPTSAGLAQHDQDLASGMWEAQQ